MICPKCGAEVENGLSFCTECGETISAQTNEASNANSSQKSKVVAVLLAFFLGGLGAHNFYLGFTKKAIIDIILSVFLGIGVLWAFVEGIMILVGKVATDSNGIYLK